MRAAIDIGSNSIRLALPNGESISTITKLADGIQATGRLSPAGIAATLDALDRYAKSCREHGCDEVIPFATEAVRKAADGAEFIKTVKEKTGLEIKLLSPEQEAALALFGADKPDGAVTVCDLGGGSLEVISSPDGKTPDYIKSLPLGAVVMKNRYSGNYRRAIDEMPSLVEEYGAVPRRAVVMSGGSACTIAAGILNLRVYDKKAVTTKFTARELDDFMPICMSERLSTLRPVCEKRADTLAYGAIVIQALLNHLHATEFYVSDAGNLEAVMKGFKL
ncbi:MAG: hypothetical protein HDT28_08150 [Clostridiales bacterium]|nr:hypothetical protein [Clostridiales bacterium]